MKTKHLYFLQNLLDGCVYVTISIVCRLCKFYYTSTKSWKGYIFITVCLYVCQSVCLMFACEQNSSQTYEPIWTRVSLNAAWPFWLEPYWKWWPPWIKPRSRSHDITKYVACCSFPCLNNHNCNSGYLMQIGVSQYVHNNQNHNYNHV